MSDIEVTPKAPRRSTRARKSITRPTNADPGKRKLNGGDTGSESEHRDDEERDEPEYIAPKTTTRGKGRKARGGAGGMTRKKKNKANGDSGNPPEQDGAKVAKDAKISDDNALFNAILSPGTALQSTAEDFLEAVDAAPADALKDLVNFILRCCGCNSSVDSDQVMDSDGIVDCIDEFTEAFKTETVPSYPLIARQAGFRKFRKSLAEFLNRVVSAAAELNSLYTSDFVPILQAWVVTMSTSPLRSFRHTATLVALNVETALCEVAASVEKEKETVTRQLESERKKKRNTERVKELETKSNEVNERRTKLKEYLKEFFDGVFVHRYRDSDPIIRADCVAALGIWSIRYSAHFLEGSNLRYLGWVLSDKATVVRHEAVKSIHGLYSKKDYIVSLHPFTERFKPRLIEMATRDIDLPTRMAVIQLLRTVDDQGLLEDEQREQLCLLIFGTEARIRKAVGGFVNSVWTEAVEGKLMGRRDLEKESPHAQAKALAELLIKWSKTVDEESKTNEETQIQDAPAKEHTKLVFDDPTLAIARRDRISLAVESLWDDIDIIRDWQSLLQLLLLDHTTEREAAVSHLKKRKAGKAKATDNAIEEAWRLEEHEEAVLLQVLLGALKRAYEDSKTKKKQDEEEVTADQISLVLIKSLSQLLAKHQTDEYRIADVLLIPRLMDLGMYLEMRLIGAYESLWDDVTKQFMHYSSPLVVCRAVATIKHMLDTPALANANAKKILELEEELGTALRDAVGAREIETAALQEEDAKRIEGVALRVACLSSTRDMMAWMEDDEGGKQSRALDIFLALLERAKLGNEAEDKLNEHAINAASYYLLWKSHAIFAIADTDSPEGHALRQALKQQRDPVIETLTDFVIGEESAVTDPVKRVAFNAVMSIYLVYCARHSTDMNGLPMPQADLQISLPEQIQYRFAGYIQAVIEQYAQELDEEDEDSGSDANPNDEDGERAKNKRRRRPKKVMQEDGDEEDALDAVHVDPARAIKDYEFQAIIAPFIRAIQTTTISFNHSTVIFTHYGRFQPMYDQMTRLLAEMLREKWHQGDTELTVQIAKRAMQESFGLYLYDSVGTEEHAIALAKLLASHFSIRGAHLAVQARLSSPCVSQILTELSNWLVQKLRVAEGKKDKEMTKKASALFRALVQLVVGLEPADALKLKALFEQSLSEAEVFPSNGKQWEGLRTFEKRLTAAISKDKNTAQAKKSRRKRGADAATDEEGDAENLVNGGISGTESEGPPHRLPRPRTRPVRARAAKDKAATATSSSENDEEEEGEDVFGAKRAIRTRQVPARGPRAKQSESVAREAPENKDSDARAMDIDPAEELEPDDSVPVVLNGSPVATPGRGKKRPREDEPEINAAAEEDVSNDVSKFPRRKHKKVKL